MTRIANSDARMYLTNKQPFKGSNMFAEGDEDFYVVYSYGYHFPIVVWYKHQWYINTDRYSRSTTRHQRYVYVPGAIKADTGYLKNIISHGRRT